MGLSLGQTSWAFPALNALSAREGKLPATERMLNDALRRAIAAKAGVTMLVLHAAELPGASTRPHRAKLARAVLDDIAEQVDGEVFRLTNGDLALLARRPGDRLGIGGLAATLGRLFGHPPADCVRYVSCWPLDRASADAASYVAGRLVAAADQTPVPAGPPFSAQEWPGPLLTAGPVWELLSRYTAVKLPDANDHAAGALIPLHHALAFSITTLQARAPMAAADIDRCMARYLAGGLEPPLLQQLAAGIGQPIWGRAANFSRLARVAPVFLALGLRALATPEFAALLAACRAAATPLQTWFGVELPWIETISDPGLFARVRSFLHEERVPWAIGALSHCDLLLGGPQRMSAELFKLDWSASLGADSSADRQATDSAIEAIGPDRIILTGADSEAAMLWGTLRGIRRFQGTHVEAMLAAARMAGCPQSRQCSLSQCSQRGTAIASPGRAGCMHPELLDGVQLVGAPLEGAPLEGAPLGVAHLSGALTDDRKDPS